MRIIQFVSYVSVDGAFGGPVAVAVAQARELARQGHEVVLLAGWDGVAKLSVPGVKVVLSRVQRTPGLGFSGLRSRGVRSWLVQHARRFDVVHIHAGRHLIDMEVAFLARRLGLRYVMQTHGMIMPGTHSLHSLTDGLLTTKALNSAVSTLALTSAEESALRSQFPDAAVSRIRNGIAPRDAPGPGARPGPEREIVFLARLHPRKRVMAFAEMASIVTIQHPEARFVVIGPDEGDLPALRLFIAAHPNIPLHYEGTLPPGEAAMRLDTAAVFVLPSFGEVFPMTVLEAFSVQTPVVLTDDCGIADEIAHLGAALVTEGSPENLAKAVDSILSNRSIRNGLIRGMRRALDESFSIRTTVDRLVRLYASSSDSAPRSKVVWLTNAAAPYRIPVWDALARSLDLEVWLLETDEHLRRDDNNRGDDWAVGDRPSVFTTRFIPNRVIRRGEARHYFTLWIRPSRLSGKAAILIGGWDSPAYWFASWSAKLAGVRRVGFYESHRLSQKYPRGAIALLRRAFLRGMDEIVVPGTAAGDTLVAEGINPKRIRIGFNTVDVEEINAATRAARARFEEQPGPVGSRLLCISQLIPRKNIASLFEAIAVSELAECTLTVVGTGPERAALERLSEELGLQERVTFSGYIPAAKLPLVFATHDVLVHPALQEVWGLAVNEALAAGLTVVVGRDAGVTPSVQQMRGVHPTGVGPRELRRALISVLPVQTIDEPEILKKTPEAYAATFRDALVPRPGRRADHV